MALVAYDTSDVSSEEEDGGMLNWRVSTSVSKTEVRQSDSIPTLNILGENLGQETKTHVITNVLPEPKVKYVPFVREDVTTRLLFSALARPKNSSFPSRVNENDSSQPAVVINPSACIPTNGSTKKIKITLPSLAEFNDEDEEAKPKKLKPSTKGSGLFSLLPAPKNLTLKQKNRKLLPHVISKSPALKNSLPLRHPNRIQSQGLINYPDSGEDSGEEENPESDFFSLTSTDLDAGVPSPPISAHSLGDTGASNSLGNTEEYGVNPGTVPPDFSLQDTTNGANDISSPKTSTEVPPDNELQLDEDAINRLCGRRGRKEIEEVHIIDVSGETHLPDPKEWLTKQFTEEQETRSHSHRRKDGPTTQQRRKHQITYLAFQAKEHELELKNQWASNRMSRKQTQAKYGF